MPYTLISELSLLKIAQEESNCKWKQKIWKLKHTSRDDSRPSMDFKSWTALKTWAGVTTKPTWCNTICWCKQFIFKVAIINVLSVARWLLKFSLRQFRGQARSKWYYFDFFSKNYEITFKAFVLRYLRTASSISSLTDRVPSLQGTTTRLSPKATDTFIARYKKRKSWTLPRTVSGQQTGVSILALQNSVYLSVSHDAFLFSYAYEIIQNYLHWMSKSDVFSRCH